MQFVGIDSKYYTETHIGPASDSNKLGSYIRKSKDILESMCMGLHASSVVSDIQNTLLMDAQCYIVDSIFEMDTDSYVGDLESVSFEDVSYRYTKNRAIKASRYDCLSLAESKIIKAGFGYRGLR